MSMTSFVCCSNRKIVFCIMSKIASSDLSAESSAKQDGFQLHIYRRSLSVKNHILNRSFDLMVWDSIFHVRLSVSDSLIHECFFYSHQCDL